MAASENTPGAEVFTEGDIRLPRDGISSPFIEETAKAVLAYLKMTGVRISVVITDNETIQKINRKYRKKDTPTDVISFAYREEPFPEGETGVEELGDIFISIEKAKTQAAENGISLKDEMKRLLVHGILHLVGYDHEKGPEEAEVMRNREDEILEKALPG